MSAQPHAIIAAAAAQSSQTPPALLTGRQRFTDSYVRIVIALGCAACVFSVFHLTPGNLDLRFVLLAAVTVGLGSRIGVTIPRVGGEITVSDTFIFVTMLVYGGEVAILLATIEAFCSARRFSKRTVTLLFNAAILACATFMTTWTLRFSFGTISALPRSTNLGKFATAICLMAFVQYIVNSGLAATRNAFKTDQPVWDTWKKYYLWTSITYFVGASAAAVIARLMGALGWQAIIIIAPIIIVVYLTYRTFLKNIEVAEKHVEELSHHVVELERVGAELQNSEQRYRHLFERNPQPTWVFHPQTLKFLAVNEAAVHHYGYTRDEFLSMTLKDIRPAEDVTALIAHVNKTIEPSDAQTSWRHKKKDGTMIDVEVSAQEIEYNEESARLALVNDITKRKRVEEQLLHDAFHDALTGLPNRALFFEHLQHAIKRAHRSWQSKYAVLFLDLDRFKIINDSLGHMVGDELLKGIARRLGRNLRPGDTVARLGGDEFTILLEDIADIEEATEIARRILLDLSVPFSLNGHEIFTTVSIGVAPGKAGYERPQDILRDADTAMYCAKMMGKACCEVFNDEMHTRAMTLLQLETDLRRAIERDEFVLNYQPIVSLETGKLKGFEALVRWQHPERGFIAPDKFIPLAEETGLILPLGHWVLTEACAQMRRWQQEFALCEDVQMSVNLSGKQFAQGDLIEKVSEVLQQTGLDARSLKLEITESAIMHSVSTATDMLTDLRALGITLSMDDFGTGYSSLSHLHRFPINTLKIDRSFVTHMIGNTENMEIVRTIVMLARNLGMDVIAEGIETKEQLAQLKNLNCEYGQGYFFSKPVKGIDATELIEKNCFYSPATLSKIQDKRAQLIVAAA